MDETKATKKKETDRHPLRVKSATYDKLKVMANERRVTLLQALEEVIERGLAGNAQATTILGESMVAVATYAKDHDMPIEKAHAYIVKVAVGEDGRGGRLGALATYNSKPKPKAKTSKRPRRAA